VFGIQSNTWKELPNLSTPRCNCAAVIFGKQWIYAIAGCKFYTTINSVERLQIDGNGNWADVYITSMFSARYSIYGI